MTAAQRIHLMAELWPRACAAQGWRAGDRELRLRVLGEAVGRTLASASELDSTGDFDAVKAHLGFLAADLAATKETLAPEEGRARRLRAVIRRQLHELAGFGGDPQALLVRILADKFAHGACDLAPALEDLTAAPTFRTDLRTGRAREGASQLDQVVFTLARILSAKRRAAKEAAARLAA
jgi:hypothetical protein